MNKKLLATLATAAFALTASATASHAFLGFEACETCGQALGAPLPEGLFFIDNEAYGRRAIGPNQGGGGGTVVNGPAPNVGVNIPTLVYSTPFVAYDTRLELVAAIPFIHLDGGPFGAGTNRVDIYQQAYGPIIAHDFGNDFGASLILLLRPPSEHFRDSAYADLRASFSYTGQGLDLTATVGYTGTFGGYTGGIGATGLHGIADAVDVDVTATKKFGKLEAGFIGYYETDINTRGDNSTFNAFGNVISVKQSAIGLGGLVGYDFGRFTLQAYALHTVDSHNQLIVPGVGGFGNEETRGFLRLIVPLYVAPAAAPPMSYVRARY